MALPFVPVEKVTKSFIRLQEEGATDDQRIDQLFSYIERNWIDGNRFPIPTWNVFGVPTRTNNDCEGWHRWLSHAAQDNPAFYVLVPLLHEEAAKLPLQQQMVAEGTLSRLQSRAMRKFQGKIYRLWSKFEAVIIPCRDLLNAVSKINGPVTE